MFMVFSMYIVIASFNLMEWGFFILQMRGKKRNERKIPVHNYVFP